MVDKKRDKRVDALIEKMDEITQLADAMVQLPVRPSISVDDIIEFEKFNESIKYQDNLAPALRQKIKNLHPSLGEMGITEVLLKELRSAKDRLSFKSIQPSESSSH